MVKPTSNREGKTAPGDRVGIWGSKLKKSTKRGRSNAKSNAEGATKRGGTKKKVSKGSRKPTKPRSSGEGKRVVTGKATKKKAAKKKSSKK